MKVKYKGEIIEVKDGVLVSVNECEIIDERKFKGSWGNKVFKKMIDDYFPTDFTGNIRDLINEELDKRIVPPPKEEERTLLSKKDFQDLRRKIYDNKQNSKEIGEIIKIDNLFSILRGYVK